MDMVEGHARQGEQHLQRLRDLEAFDLFKEEDMVWNGWRMGCEVRVERLVPGVLSPCYPISIVYGTSFHV